MPSCKLKPFVLLIGLGAMSGTSCPLNPSGGSSDFPKTQAWTRRTINGSVAVRPVVVAVADFDGDSRLDVVAGYAGSTLSDPAVYIFFQNSTTDFAVVRIGTGSDLAGIAALAIADMDGDTRLDVVAACNGRVIYLHSPSDPRESANWAASTIDNSSGTGIGQWNDLAIGQIDGENGPDIVACGQNSSRLSWFRNPRSGTMTGLDWTRVDIDATTRSGAASVALADFSGDSRLDVVSTATGESEARIAWYRNPAAPASDAWTKFPVGNLPAASRLVIADLNADGRTDCVGLNGPGRQIGWYIRPADATGTWTSAGYLLTEFSANTPVDLKAADLDGNGQVDVVVGTSSAPTIRWFTPVGVQTQQWVENNLADLNTLTPGRFAIGDIDGDGRPDVIAPLQGSSTSQDLVAWFENPE